MSMEAAAAEWKRRHRERNRWQRGGSDTCHKLCDKGEALNCPMDTKGDCASQCAASPAKCSTQLNALAACAQTITYMCVDGEATPNGCDTEFGAYLQCALSQ